MKKFNKSIEVKVSVDSIADRLLSMMNGGEPHKETVVESIIGRMLATDKDGIGFLFNALNGVSPEVPFAINEEINVTDVDAYGYWTEGERTRKPITTGNVISIDPYSNKPVCISFEVPQTFGNMTVRTEWIELEQCSKITAQLAAL